MISCLAILLFMIGSAISQTSTAAANYTYVNPNFGTNKCGTVGTNQPATSADCFKDLRVSSNTCCMLTILQNNKNFTACDSVPTMYLIGTNYKQSAANDVKKLGLTFVDYDCGTVTMRPPQLKNATKEMGSNECGTVNANMPQKLEDCSLDKSLQHNTCCYLKGTYQGYAFSSCSAYASKNPWGEDYKGIVTKILQPLGITVNDYVCASNYLTTSLAVMLLVLLNFLF